MADPTHTVLIIDDDPKIVQLIKRVLGPMFRVETAGGVFEGMAILERERIDLVLLDIGLPGLSGLDLFRRMKSDLSLRYTPVVFISGQPFAGGDVEHLESPPDGFISKPFSLMDLVAGAESAIRRVTRAQRDDFFLSPGDLN